MAAQQPRTPDLAIGRHALMAEAFEVLAMGMGPFIDERMAAYFADDPSWQEAAANRMGRANEHGAADPLFQLLVMRRFWGPVFADFFGQDLRGLINRLIDARNHWAHFNVPDDANYIDQVLLSIERLLAPVDPDPMRQLRHLRARIKNPLGLVDAAEADPGVDLTALQTQLGETTNAFAELQNQVRSMKEQLVISQKASAGKQLRLAQLEQLLLERDGAMDALSTDLATEREARNRTEWLFVGFISVMIILMAIIGRF